MPKRRQISSVQQSLKGTWGLRVRDKIDSTLLVERLQRVALGEEEATQVSMVAAKMLLDRTVPTIQSIQVEVGDGGNAKTITNDQLFGIIEGQSKRISHDP